MKHSPKRIMILVGHFASGKSSVAQRLEDLGMFHRVEMGDIVRARATQVNESPFVHAKRVMTSRDQLVFTRHAIAEIEQTSGLPPLLVGVRSPIELELIRASFDSVVIALCATPDVRQHRWQQRTAKGQRVPDHTWAERETTEKEFGIDEIIATADHCIDANMELDTVVSQVLKCWDTVPSQE